MRHGFVVDGIELYFAVFKIARNRLSPCQISAVQVGR